MLATDPNLDSPPCPLCGSDDYALIMQGARDRLTRKPGVFSLQRCVRCELVATRPRLTAHALDYYYAGTYSGAGARAARALQTGAVGTLVARSRLRAVLALHKLSTGDRMLDVGCGYGALLSEAVRATGCNATGIDIDAGCLAAAMDRDRIAYHAGTLESIPLEPASFDVITFFESLEHHADPVRTLKQARKLLKPGGVCIVEVPNFDGAWRHVFRTWWLPLLVPQHLVHFTPRTLRGALQAAGLRVERPHKAMFYPSESTASLGLALNELMRRPVRGYRLRWSRPDALLLLAVLLLWWCAVEVPTQLVLKLVGRTGHQLMAGYHGDRP